MIERTGSATWWGTLSDGKGEVSVESGVLSRAPCSANTSFGDDKGTNPEELLGAAHASCFSMALAGALGEHGIRTERIDTDAKVSLAKIEGGYRIETVALRTRVEAPDAEPEVFERVAQEAKDGCPVSGMITLDATLVR